jgi:hypothetical protein
MPVEETLFLLGYLLGDEEGRAHARRIDRKVAALPGMTGLAVVENWLVKHDVLSPAPAPASVTTATPPTELSAWRSPTSLGTGDARDLAGAGSAAS